MVNPISRAAAAALAAFLVLSLVFQLRTGDDGVVWAMDLRRLGPVAAILELTLAAALGGFAVRPRMSDARRRCSIAVAVIAAAFCLIDAVRYEWLLYSGRLAG